MMYTSILKGLRRPQWIAETPEQFARIVAKLSTDLVCLRTTKTKLRGEVLASPLSDGADLCRKQELAITAIKIAGINYKIIKKYLKLLAWSQTK